MEPVIAVGMLMAAAFCVKHLVWGRGPISGRHHRVDSGELEQRVADLEERLAHSADVIAQQAEALADVEERLEFSERMLTQQRSQDLPLLEEPTTPTPA